MGLRLKFNLILALVFLFGLFTAGCVSYLLLQRSAREEITENARVMMEAAMAVREYTVNRIKPNLELQLMRGFLAESVPAFAATETFNILRKKYPKYSYKEAALNPTNPRDKAEEWEAEIVNRFQGEPTLTEFTGERESSAGPSFFMAKPIKISQESCLTCHSTPAVAPKTMLAVYGEANGFGWKLNEVIGAQIVSVPTSVPIEKANHAFTLLMGSLFGVFLLVFVVLNVMLSIIVIRRIRRMSGVADEVSMGKLDIPELEINGGDEVSVLASSFNRMRRSLEKAMKLLDG